MNAMATINGTTDGEGREFFILLMPDLIQLDMVQ